MKITHYILLIVGMLFGSTAAFGAHIIGGEITYECLGGDQYRFTIRMYRDCQGNGARFDSDPSGNATLGTVSIYLGNSSNEFANVILPAPVISEIDPMVSNPCLIVPPNICVEEGIYVFDVRLPQSALPYHISYSRCCRNRTIQNLVNPQTLGTTYTMELTPEAQSSCNSSPVFTNLPPIVICAGEPIDFDFSATDSDGDRLVYSLCAPFNGGGNDEQNALTPGGVAPDPDLPPPYNQIPFSAPFTPNDPMGGTQSLAIDPVTGFITGIPDLLGQYVVGVCVEEFRGNTLLSVVRRDFQFNVASCEPTVVADIREDSLVQNDGPNLFIVNNCGDLEVNFVNESFQQQNIQTYNWLFDINGTPSSTTTRDASIEFPNIGQYDGLLILNEGLVCADTALIRVNILPALTGDFSFDYDTCTAGPVDFTNNSFSELGPGVIDSYNWDFAGQGTSSDADPSFTFSDPGELDITLTVRDTNGCVEVLTRRIDYFPVPELLVIEPSEVFGCAPQAVFFDNLSAPLSEAYDIIWDFGDGNTGTGVSPTHIYELPGTYSVSLDITSPVGCMTDTFFQDQIIVRASPTAGFSYRPEQPNSFNPEVTFQDESIDAVQWEWTFNTNGVSRFQNPVFSFPDTGLQRVQQVVFHESGCTDTLIQILDVIPLITYFLPNAFTPNGDGKNDFFAGNGVLDGIRNFNFQIWNRYGELIFETDDYTEAWQGRKNNTGDRLPPGAYAYRVSFIGPRSNEFEFKGLVNLVY